MSRIKWIDTSKAIGIILVVYAHALTKNTYIWNVIQQFHMPLFFVLSGFLYKGCSIDKNYIKKKMKSLWLPFVIVNILSFVFLLSNNANIFYIVKIILLFETSGVFGPTWFLGSLFYISIFVAILYRFVNKISLKQKTIIFINFSLMFVFLLLGFFTPVKGYHISATFMGAGYYIFGYNLKLLNIPNKLFNSNYFIKILLLVSCMSLLFGISIINNCSFSSGFYTNAFLSVVSALSGIIIVIIMSNYFCNTMLNKLGGYSLEIMIWHLLSFKFIILIQIFLYHLDFAVINSYPYYDNNGFWVYVLTIFGLIIPICMSKLYNKIIKLLNIVSSKGKILKYFDVKI